MNDVLLFIGGVVLGRRWAERRRRSPRQRATPARDAVRYVGESLREFNGDDSIPCDPVTGERLR